MCESTGPWVCCVSLCVCVFVWDQSTSKKPHYMSDLNKLIVCTSPFLLEEGVEPPTNVSKRGEGMTGSQFLEGGCWWLLCNFIEITVWHGCFPVNLLHIFTTHFPKNTYGWLLLSFASWQQTFSLCFHCVAFSTLTPKCIANSWALLLLFFINWCIIAGYQRWWPT